MGVDDSLSLSWNPAPRGRHPLEPLTHLICCPPFWIGIRSLCRLPHLPRPVSPSLYPHQDRYRGGVIGGGKGGGMRVLFFSLYVVWSGAPSAGFFVTRSFVRSLIVVNFSYRGI